MIYYKTQQITDKTSRVSEKDIEIKRLSSVPAMLCPVSRNIFPLPSTPKAGPYASTEPTWVIGVDG